MPAPTWPDQPGHPANINVIRNARRVNPFRQNALQQGADGSLSGAIPDRHYGGQFMPGAVWAC